MLQLFCWLQPETCTICLCLPKMLLVLAGGVCSKKKARKKRGSQQLQLRLGIASTIRMCIPPSYPYLFFIFFLQRTKREGLLDSHTRHGDNGRNNHTSGRKSKKAHLWKLYTKIKQCFCPSFGANATMNNDNVSQNI